jgi:hypothetical protein
MKTMIMAVRELNAAEIVKHNNSDKGVAIVLRDETGNETVLDYMYSFRGYSFQIGGLGGCGSSFNSTVIGFGNVVAAMLNSKNMEKSNSSIYASNVALINEDGNGNSVIAELINGQAVICINKMVRCYSHMEEYSDVRIVLSKEIGDCDELWNRDSKSFESHPWRRMILDTVSSITKLI